MRRKVLKPKQAVGMGLSKPSRRSLVAGKRRERKKARNSMLSELHSGHLRAPTMTTNEYDVLLQSSTCEDSELKQPVLNS